MHLVKEGFLNELMTTLEITKVEEKESSWWTGRAMGLLEAGYLTQAEHDEIVAKAEKDMEQEQQSWTH